MRKFAAGDFVHHVPEGEGELRSQLISLGHFQKNHVSFEFRCRDELTVELIDSDGQSVFWDRGRVVKFDGSLDGFEGVRVESATAFCYWFRGKGRWLEVPDPVPMSIDVDEPANKPTADLIREELRRYMARKNMDSELATDVGVEELLDDLEHGDLEFDDEPDMFGLSAAEMHEESERLARAARAAQEDHEEPSAQPAAQSAADPSGPSNAPAGDGSVIAEKPGGSPST